MIRNAIARGLCATVMLGLVLPATAAPKATAKPAKDATIWCPLMEQNVSKAKATSSVVNGKTYYFCCKQCKKMFDKDPNRAAIRYNMQVAAHNKAKKG
ncbi:MAG: YHS domain-containing protein [Abitibacteriaceae bacterium]|nr:YHS domain-containing protein [Abditibacteriaceae bacterium]MBV9867791.1 YHS domain-containing protein [Abditibacteriaceae bacterium]